MKLSALLISILVLLGLALSGLNIQHKTIQRTLSQTSTNDQSESIAEDTLQMAYSEAIGNDDAAYHFQHSSKGYTATNSAHDLTIDITGDMVKISAGEVYWQLSSEETATDFSVEGNRLTLHRDGYDEWYVNGPVGLQQGFTLFKPSKVVFKVGGTLPTTASDHSLHIGDALTFSGLMAYNANEQAVPVKFALDDDRLAYVYDDAGATYPLTIDPWVQQQKLLPLDGAAGDRFGVSVALSGATALIGAPANDDNGLDSGSAYVFVRSGTTWIQQGKLLPLDGAADDYFGWSVALSGDTALVGALHDDDNGTDSGSAYVFVRSGTVWSQQQKLLPLDGAADDYFGWSVALSGDTALVGSFLDDDNGLDSGSAYVFVRSGTVWSQQGKLLPLDGTAFAFFGSSVALNGDTALVGANGEDNGLDSGSAYVFVRSGTVWSQQQKLLPLDGAADDRFGYSVALSGATALIGAPANDDNGLDSGSAYVFVRSGTTWIQQGKLLPLDGAAFDNFGWSVALSGDTSLVGAYADDDNGTNSGSAYVFVRSGTVWSQQQKLLPLDGAALDFFGSSVALTGDTALVGAQHDDDNGADSGSAYVFATLPLAASAACVGANLVVTIVSGDGPFNITGTGPGLPLNAVNMGTHVLTGPGTWTGVTVTETVGDGQFLNLDNFTCEAPTDTPIPPTNTPIPPTNTPTPPTDTPVLPTGTDTPVPPTDTLVPPTDTPIPPTDTPVPPTDTPPGPVVLNVSAVCVDENLAVTISAGDGPFNITASAGINTPVLGVDVGTTTINGPEKWDDLTVTETTGNTQSINLGQFRCRSDERPVPVWPNHRSHTTSAFPIFSWTGITNANNYRVFVFDDANPATRTVDIRQNSGGPTNMQLSTPLPDGRLFWRVRGRQNRIWSLWSIRFTLFKDPAVPFSANTPIPTIDLNPPSGDDSLPSPAPTVGPAPTFPPPPNSR